MLVSQSLISKAETTAVIKWSADAVSDYLWYTTDNGLSWHGVNIANGTSGSYTISRLTTNTTYRVKTRLREKNTLTTSDSTALSVTTYSYPYANNTPNFTIGGVLQVGIFNPLGRTVTVSILGADGSTCGDVVISGDAAKGFNDNATVSALFNSLPSAKSGVYRVKVSYDGFVSTRTGGYYFVGDESPTVGGASYQDVNAVSVAITGNNKLIVQNQSTVEFSVTDLQPGAGATLISCTVEINEQEHDLTLSGTTATGGNFAINSASDVVALIKATDTRGQTTVYRLPVVMLPWESPTAVINIVRQSNYYTNTDITVNTDYSSLNGHNAADVRCRFKKTTESTYGADTILTDGITSTLALDNQYNWDVQVTIHDYFASVVYNVIVPVGMPIVFFDTSKQSTGFNCFPKNNKSVEISGEDVFKALFYDVADTLTLSGVPLAGLVTSSTKSAYFLIQTPKSLKYISTVTVDSCTGGIRSATGGYFNSAGDSTDWLNDSDCTIAALKQGDNLIQLLLKYSTAYTNTPNNAPCSMYATSISLSFS